MKGRYWIVLVIVVSLLIFLEVWLYNNLEKDKPIERMITMAGVFVAIGSSIVALSNADRKPKKIRAEVKIYASATEEIEVHLLKDTIQKIRDFYKNSPESVTSYRVNFKITNKSRFTLISPTLIFKLPEGNQHPEYADVPKSEHEPEVKFKIWRLTYRSNLYYNQEALKTLRYADSLVFTESSLPYLNPKEDPLKFWIRMVLDDKSTEKVRVSLSLNSTNAEGAYYYFELVPKELLSGKVYVKT